MFKKRFASLFDSCRKRKGMVSLIMAVLLLGIIGLSAGCNLPILKLRIVSSIEMNRLDFHWNFQAIGRINT